MLTLLRSRLRSLSTCTFLVALVISRVVADGEELHTYRNDAAGYTFSYPSNWYPSPPFYANAFEIRNYDASHGVPEKDQASIITTQEHTASPEQAERRIQDVVAAASTGTRFHLDTFRDGPQLLYQWTVLERPAVPARHPSKEGPVQSNRMRMRVASAVIVGPYVVRMEGKAWEDTDPQIITVMKQITRSIKQVGQKGATK